MGLLNRDRLHLNMGDVIRVYARIRMQYEWPFGGAPSTRRKAQLSVAPSPPGRH
jgi:hypothetical protein